MELRCDLCSASLARVDLGGTFSCGHNICICCYQQCSPPECITCQIKPNAASGSGILKPSTQNHIPHKQANPSFWHIVSPTTTPRHQTSSNANPQPHVSSSAVPHPNAPPYNSPQPNTTLCSTVQDQQTWFGPSAPEESGHQNSTKGMEGRSDIEQIHHNIQMGNLCCGPQQTEQDGDIGQQGTTGSVSQLRQRFDSGGATAQEGATGWKNQEGGTRTPQGSSYTSRQQDTLAGHKEPQGTQSYTPSLSPSSERQRIQLRRHNSRGPQPYPLKVLTKDPHLTDPRTREPMPSPSGSTNTFPPPGNRHPSPSTSSAAGRHANPPHSSSRPREPSPSSSGARNPSRSSSRNRNASSSSSSPSSSRQTNPSRSSSRTREQSPSPVNAGSHSHSSSRSRDPSSSHPRDRISSPSPARQSDCFCSSSSPRDPSCPSSRHSSPSLYPSGSRKSSPTPSEATEPFTVSPYSNGTLFSGTHSKGEHANGATSHHTATYEPRLKQPLTLFSSESLPYPRTHRPSTTTPTTTMTRGRHHEEQEQWMEEKGLQGELKVQIAKGDDQQPEELKRRQETQKRTDDDLSSEIDTMQQSAMRYEGKLNLKKEMLDRKEEEWTWLKEEYAKQQKEIVALEEKDRRHQEELAKLEELSRSQQNQAQEHTTTLTQENTELKKEVKALREARDAQERETSHWKAEYDKQQKEEIQQLRTEEWRHQQEAHSRWERTVMQQQTKIATLEEENKQLREKYNCTQNELQHMTEKWAEQMTAASDLKQKITQHQNEEMKLEAEVRRLQQKMSDKCMAWEEERNLCTGNMTVLEGKVTSLEEENSRLLMKDIQSQKELAALRTSKEDERRSLIRERDTCQEEADKLKKDKETLKEKISLLRQERNDRQLTIHELEHKVSQFSEHIKNNVFPEINDLQRKKAALEEEATQLRHERDQYKEEVNQLKTRAESVITCMRQERDKYKNEEDQLKGRPYSCPEKTNELNFSVKKVAELQQERDSMEMEIDRLKQEGNTTRGERDEYKEKADNLKREVTAVENQMTAVRRERDSYKKQIDEHKAQYDKIIQMATEKNNYKPRGDEESSMIALLQQDIHNYRMRIDEHKGNETTLQNKITNIRTETENHVRNLDAQIMELQQDKGYYKERISEYEISEATLKKQIEHMGRVIENQQKDMDSRIAQLMEERDGYEKKVEAVKQREATFENQMKQMRDKSNHETEVVERCKREEGEYRQKVNQLTRKNYMLENQLQEMARDKDSCKREAEREVKKANQLTSKNFELEDKLKQMTKDKEDIGRQNKEWNECRLRVDQLLRKNSELENQLKQMRDKSKHETEVVERCKREEGKYRQKVDQLTRKNYMLENQLQEMARDKDSCNRKAEREVNKSYLLMSKNSELEGQLNKVKNERDTYKNEKNSLEKEIDSYKRESDNHRQEIDRLKTRQNAEVTQHGQGTDQHQTVAERPRKQSGAGDAGPKEAAQSERGLNDFLATPTHSQQSTSGAAEAVDVVMAGPEEGATPVLREEQPGTHRLEVPATQGLPNLGNTAYISSVVQCLYHLSPLRNTLATCHQYLYQHNQSGTGVAAALAQLFGAMQAANEMGVRFATRELKSVLGSYDATFNGRQQQEAHDLFTALVSCLQSDLCQHSSLNTFPRASSLFDGQLETSMVCLETGAPLTHTTEAFTSLSLPVVEARQWFLKDLLDKHFRVQEMDWDCERCHFTHKCSHSTRIRRCPPLLVIHFSRVANYNSTRKVKVNFPVAQLNLQPYIAPDAPRSPQYRLVGVVCHEGTMAYGHYTSYCRYGRGRRSGRWRLCNDMQLQDVKERTVLEDESAHMLFYIQQ